MLSKSKIAISFEENKYKDLIHLVLLFILLIFITYFTSKFINITILAVILFAFLRTKDNIIYIAFYFIIIAAPGDLFLWDFSPQFFAGVGIGNLFFWMVFIIAATIKALTVERTQAPFFLKENITVLILYLLFLLIVFGVYKFPSVVRLSLPWLYLFFLSRFFKSIDDYTRFFNMIFYFTFIVLLFQIIHLVTGNPVASLLGDTTTVNIKSKLIGNEEILRPVSGIIISFLSIVGAIFFLSFKDNKFSRNFLFSILLVSTLSITITATRGWMLASLFIVFIYFVFISKNKIKAIITFSIPATILIVILSFTPLLEKQTDLALKRFETILLIAQGDPSAGGTLNRIDKYSPRVMKKFNESPIIGNGFSMDASLYSNGHIGNQNLLMHTGIIGYLLFVLLWVSLIVKLNSRNKTLSKINKYHSTNIILILTFLGLIIIHSTSTQIFNYLLPMDSGFLILFLFSFANFVYWASLKEEKRLKLQDQIKLAPAKK